MVLMHIPFLHRSGIVLHSSISRLVASVTDTPVGPHGVDAHPILAQVWHCLALVNIPAQRTQALLLAQATELLAAPPRTQLTRLPPSCTHSTAAVSLRHHTASSALTPAT